MKYEEVSNASREVLSDGLFGCWVKCENNREYRLLVTHEKVTGAPFLVSGSLIYSIWEVALDFIPNSNSENPVCGFVEFDTEHELFSWISDSDDLELCKPLPNLRGF